MKIPHELFSYGKGRKTFEQVGSFLCFRQQEVLNGVKSDPGFNPVFVGCHTGHRSWSFLLFSLLPNTVKPVLSGHSKIDKTKVLLTNGSLMKDESIAECSLF